MVGTYGIFALPFVGLGILLFGVPIRTAIGAQIREKWGAAIALLWGGIAGKLTFFAMQELLFSGGGMLLHASWNDFGIIFGTVSGAAYWYFARRALDEDSTVT